MNKLLLSLLLVSVAGCSQIDDYMLGKDNTPVPKALSPIKSKAVIHEAWSIAAGFPKKGSSWLKLKPIVVGDSIYTADASGVIQAANMSSGQILWSKKVNAAIISGPAVLNQYLIVGTDSSKLIAFEKQSGKQLWQANVSGDVLAKPLITANKVIAKTIDGNLYAFDLATGRQLWLSVHGSPGLILKASSAPVVVDNKMIISGYSDGKMDALDLKTGQLLWQRSIAYASGASDVERLVDIDADPIVQGNTVLLATYQGYVGALSLSTGDFIWRKPASTYNNIVVSGNTLYMTDSNDVVRAINKTTGQVNWKQVLLKARGLTEPVLMGNRLVIGDKTGMLHILSADNGEFISRIQLASPIYVAPLVAGNAIFVMTANGKLSRFSVS